MESKVNFIEDFKHRTKQFTLRAIRTFQYLPNTAKAQIIGKQFLRSASSIGANYREPFVEPEAKQSFFLN